MLLVKNSADPAEAFAVVAPDHDKQYLILDVTKPHHGIIFAVGTPGFACPPVILLAYIFQQPLMHFPMPADQKVMLHGNFPPRAPRIDIDPRPASAATWEG